MKKILIFLTALITIGVGLTMTTQNVFASNGNYFIITNDYDSTSWEIWEGDRLDLSIQDSLDTSVDFTVEGDVLATINIDDTVTIKMVGDKVIFSSDVSDKVINMTTKEFGIGIDDGSSSGDEFEVSGNGDLHTMDVGGGYSVEVFISAQDLDAPIIDGTSYYQTNVDAPVSIATIKSWLSARDNIDGDVTSSIQLVTEGTTYAPSANMKLGTFKAKFSANDKSGNYNYHTVTVYVYDVTKPIITFNGELETGTLINKLSSPYTGNIENLIIVNDNYDSKHSIAIDVKHTGEEINLSKPGVYTRTVTATDSSGNMATRDYTVKTIDDVKPVITTPKDPVRVGSNAPISIEYFLSLFSAKDNVDGIVDFTLVDNTKGYFYNKNIPGTYTEQIRAVDKAGNVALVSFTITVYDNVPPAIFVNEEFLILNIDNVPTTLEGIIAFFQKTGQINAKYDIQEDTFSGNEGLPGEYKLKVMSFNSLDEATEVEIKVRVLDTETSKGMLDDSLNESIISKYKLPIIITASALVAITLIVVAVALTNKKQNNKNNYDNRKRKY